MSRARRMVRVLAVVLTALGAELCLDAGAAALAGRANPASPTVSEADVKATFLFNFAKFASWPLSALPAGAPLEACVFGETRVATTLEGFDGHMVDGHRLAVKRVIDPADLQFCHLVFVSDSEGHRVATALSMTKGVSALTVGEQPDFLQRGGIINFVAEDNRVRFDINQAAAERVSLKLSAHLLRLARRIGDGSRP